MRNPDRIDGILKVLADYWKKYPDLRLGQIIYNISCREFNYKDSYYIEDDMLLDWLCKELNIDEEK
jgi:uncharacterized protein YihD (DUF1040 family)